jgi:hypothetical protein
VLAILASRERVWANGRISIGVALVFAPITTAATFIHFGLFHTDTFFGWFWIVAYSMYPPMLLVMLYRQLRTPGGDPPRTAPLPVWVRAVFVSHAAVLLPLGVIMFVAPGVAGHLWPWPLTPLTSQALSAWVLAFGGIGAHALYENDVDRVRVPLLGYPVLVLLHAIALARFGSDMQWGEPGAWVYVAFLASCVALGAFGVAHRRPAATTAQPGRGAPAVAR